MNLKNGTLKYIGPTDLMQYKVEGYEIKRVENSKNDVVANLRFKRLYENHLCTTFFPSLSLLAVSYCTLFFKKEHFKTSVPVSITTMLGMNYINFVIDRLLSDPLVMYTLYTGIAQSLPDTAYVKAIEVWLLFHLIVPFFIFIILFR